MSNKLQFGSTENDREKVTAVLERAYGKDDFYGASIAGPVQLMDDFCGYAAKSLEDNYIALRNFLDSLPLNFYEEVRIIVMGHSLMGIDFPYYRDILIPWAKSIAARWEFYCWSKRDEDDAREFCREYSVKFSLKNW